MVPCCKRFHCSRLRDRVYHVPPLEVPPMDRRNFLAAAGATAALGWAMPLTAPPALALDSPLPELPLPPNSLFQQDEERYWADLRRQFLIPADEVYLNNGTVGSSP